jgi:hypothetical protein
MSTKERLVSKIKKHNMIWCCVLIFVNVFPIVIIFALYFISIVINKSLLNDSYLWIIMFILILYSRLMSNSLIKNGLDVKTFIKEIKQKGKMK